MEEVWKDISLSCLHSPLNLNPPTNGTLFQDFLDRPRAHHHNNNNPPPPPSASSAAAAPTPHTSLSLSQSNLRDTQFSFQRSSAPPPPATTQMGCSPGTATGMPYFLSGLNSSFDKGFGSASPCSPSQSPAAGCGCRFDKKSNFGGSSDREGGRRHARMMKNRESAARSRARRQAYTYELERERDLLIQENARLKKKLQQSQRESSDDAGSPVPDAATTPAPAAPASTVPSNNRRLLRSFSSAF